jgi:hypothetical protein
MRTVPQRSGWIQLPVVLVLMLGGPYGGLRLATTLTPASDVVQTLSPLAFGVILVGGLFLWMGLGIIAVVGSFFLRLLRGRSPREGAPGSGEVLVPPGSRAFVVLGVLVGGATGCVAGLLGDLGFLAALAAWTGAGTLYGAILWGTARSGYLPFPEPE